METPELDKQSAVIATGAPAAVQEFYDWAHQQGLRLCYWAENLKETVSCEGIPGSIYDCSGGAQTLDGEPTSRPCRACGGTGERTVSVSDRWMEDGRTPEQLLADHFGIDRDKIEAERRVILAPLGLDH